MSLVDKNTVFWKKIGDETVILNVDSGYYYTLGDVGGRMWEMLAADQNEDDITAEISYQYSVKEESVAKDLRDLIKDLKKEKLLSKNNFHCKK